VSDQSEGASVPAASPPQPRVLLVEEDLAGLGSLAESLRQRGIHVLLANGVSMACERAKTTRVDVVIAAGELSEARDEGLSLLDALAIELGQLPPVLLLVREGPGPLQGEAVLRGDLDALVARVLVLSPPHQQRGVESTPPLAAYAGSLTNVSISDVVETLSAERKTGSLSVTAPAGIGDIRLLDGAVVDAVYVRFEGMKALARMVNEKEGRFLFTPDTPTVLGRMSSPTRQLLRDVAAQSAEAKRLRARLGDLSAKALLATEGAEHAELSPLARATLAKLRAPATLDELLDDVSEPDASVLAALVELDGAGRLKRLPHEMHRAPLVGTEQLHLMRALASRAVVAGYDGAARLVFAGTPSRLAVFAHAALRLVDAVAPSEPTPSIPIPHSIATVRLGDDVDVELVALPLVPAYAPLWPLTLAGSAIVIRLDDAAGSALAEACSAAELQVLDANALVGALEEGSVAQTASLIRAAIEATQPA
jgi:CheY-like chemotaxis protein